MKNQKNWHPSKYTLNSKGILIASRDENEVAPSSRFIADLTAKWYQDNINNYCKGDLLDLGCGKAPLYGTYKSLAKKITLADWGNSLHKNIHLDVECDITKKLPFKNNSFDTIILSDVLEHTPNPHEVLSELHRILRPNGHILLNVPFAYPLHEIPYDFNRYTEYMLAKLSDDQGFNIISINAIAGGWGVLLDLTSKLFMNRKWMVSLIQKYGPILLKNKLHIRNEYPLAYTAILRKDK